MPKTNYSNNKVQSNIYGGVAMSAPATWYVGWSTTTPNQDGSQIYTDVGMITVSSPLS